MQTYDLLMLAVLIGAAMFGFMKGMAWQIASIASLVLSYFVALKFSARIAPFFGDSEPWNRYVAMLVTYVGCSFAIWLIFRVVSGVIDRVKLKEFDRQMGALLGAAKGVLLCVAITFFAVTLLPDARKEEILASRSGHYIGVLLKRARDVVPENFDDVIGPVLDRVQQRLNQQPGDPPTGQDPASLPDWNGQFPQDVSIDWPSTWPEDE